MSTILIKVGGAAAALSGALVLAQVAWDVAVGGLTEGRGESALHTTQMLVLVPGFVGLYLAQRHRFGVFGQIATLVALVGSTLMFGAALTEVTILPELPPGSPLTDDPGPTTTAVFVTAFVLWLAGLFLFGLATWRAGVLPRPAAALLTLGIVAALALSHVVPGILAGYAVGLIWLGISAATRRTPELVDGPEPAAVAP